MEIPVSMTNAFYTLRSHYSKYLSAYEAKYGKVSVLGDAIKNDFLEVEGVPPPNATVTCTEMIIPQFSSVASWKGEPTRQPFSVSDSQQSWFGHRENLETSFDRKSMTSDYGFHRDPQIPHANSSSFPFTGERRNSLPNFPTQGFPASQFMAQQQQQHQQQQHQQQQQLHQQQQQQQQQKAMYAGAGGMAQMSSQQGNHPASQYPQHTSLQQRYSSSILGGPQPGHSGGQSSTHEPNHSFWSRQPSGGQYGSMTNDFMSDYSSSQGGRSARPQLPQQQVPLGHTSPYSSYPERQPTFPHYQHQYRPTPSTAPSPGLKPQAHLQQSKIKFQTQHSHVPLKREPTFPSDSVECTRPIFTKRRKLTSRDLGMHLIFISIVLLNTNVPALILGNYPIRDHSVLWGGG